MGINLVLIGNNCLKGKTSEGGIIYWGRKSSEDKKWFVGEILGTRDVSVVVNN